MREYFFFMFRRLQNNITYFFFVRNTYKQHRAEIWIEIKILVSKGFRWNINMNERLAELIAVLTPPSIGTPPSPPTLIFTRISSLPMSHFYDFSKIPTSYKYGVWVGGRAWGWGGGEGWWTICTVKPIHFHINSTRVIRLVEVCQYLNQPAIFCPSL